MPLIVLISAIGIDTVILRRLPPVPQIPKEASSDQDKTASAFRGMGFVYVGGFVAGILSLLAGSLNGLPHRLIVLIFLWSAFLIGSCFWGAKRCKNKAPKTPLDK